MNKVMEVARADDVTGNLYSVAITAQDRVHFVKGTCKEESTWWLEVLQIFPRSSIKTGRAKRKYGGSTGWLLAHDKERDLWQLRHHHYPFLTISMEDKDSLPVGIHQWVVANDTCNLGQTTRF